LAASLQTRNTHVCKYEFFVGDLPYIKSLVSLNLTISRSFLSSMKQYKLDIHSISLKHYDSQSLCILSTKEQRKCIDKNHFKKVASVSLHKLNKFFNYEF